MRKSWLTARKQQSQIFESAWALMFGPGYFLGQPLPSIFAESAGYEINK